MENPRLHLGLRFLSRFRCIAGACEETCCAGWTVPVDETRYAAIQQAMSGSEAERAEFAQVFTPHVDAKYRTAALVVLRDGARCSLLDDERLCSLQRRYGESVLPDICAAYPRVASRVFNRVEIAGSLSCPELARKCLLAEDATELIEYAPESLGRLRTFLELEAPRNLYEAAFTDVRGLTLHFFSQRQFPMTSRLFFLAFFAQKSLPLLHRKGGPEDAMRLQRMMEEAGHPEVLARLHDKFSHTEVEEPFAITVVTQLIEAAAKAERHGFHRTLDEVLADYASDAKSGVRFSQNGRPTFDPEALHAAYPRRRKPLSAELEARIELYFENFCTNHIFKDWYLRAPNLLQHVLSLLSRVALIRFLLRSHPTVIALADDNRDLAAQKEALDQAAVRVFYTVSRALDHAEPLMNALQESLSEQGMDTLGHAIALIKI